MPIEFNPYQQRVIAFRRGYAVTMAAPGSGKTAVIIARIRALLSEGVPQSEILSLTFTKEGAKEMQKRAGLKDEDIFRGVNKHRVFTTFHSWALRFITAEARSLPFTVHTNFHGQPAPLCLPLDAARTLAQICRRLPDIMWKDAASYISTQKRRGISPYEAAEHIEHEKEEIYAIAYQKYEQALQAKGLMDFDSIVIETAKLLESRDDVRARWQFDYLQVDEAQDTDSVQWRIVKALTQRSGNALAVGDENQGMYSWRGSESNLTQYFCAQFPSAIVMPLPVNYRSTGSIVDYCKEIAPIQNETVTGLTTPNPKGIAPEFLLFAREDEEAKTIIGSCMDLGNTAVLARTNRQLAVFEDECGQRNLRYKLLGKSGFWAQPEVKDTVAILAAVTHPTDKNILRMLTARCDATKYVRKSDSREVTSTPTLLQQFQQSNNRDGQTSLYRLMQRFSCHDSGQDDVVRSIGRTLADTRAEIKNIQETRNAVQRIMDRFGVLSFYDVVSDDPEDKKNFDNDPLENVQKIVEFSTRHTNLESFYDYTQRARKATLARTNCLILSTIHQAKGKEWKNVHVIGVNDGVLPHSKGDESEERRIYFVACSRAEDKLVVSASGVPSVLIQDRLPKSVDGQFEIAKQVLEGFQLQI